MQPDIQLGQGQGRPVEAPWVKYFVVADVGAVSTEQSPFSDHCSNEFEVVSSIHNIIARPDGVYIVKIRGKGEGPVEPKY